MKDLPMEVDMMKLKKFLMFLVPFALLILASNSSYFIKDVIIQIMINCTVSIILIISTINVLKNDIIQFRKSKKS